MLSLLSTNQSQRELKLLFNRFSISLTLLSPNTRQESFAYRSKSQSTACGMSFTYKRKMSGPSIEPCGTPHVNSPGDEKSFPMFSKKVRLVRYYRNQNKTESGKRRCFIFSRKISWSIVSNAFCRSIPVKILFSSP